MRKGKQIFRLIPFYISCLTILIVLTMVANKVVTVFTESQSTEFKHSFVIDAGHGGVDGGATSCTGVLESNINLQIALKLNDMMHLLGLNTIMIRTEDISVYTEGESIAAKKISDLKERIRIVNDTPGAILISIHQNHFTDPQYSGAQVFYGKAQGSQNLAEKMQNAFISTLNTNRKIKKAEGIYLMENVKYPAVLIECGFISNQIEETLLLNDEYQKKLCAIIACVCSQYLEESDNLA